MLKLIGFFLLSGQLHFHQPVGAGPGVCLDGGTIRGIHAFRQQAGDFVSQLRRKLNSSLFLCSTK
jgi:hypothetical protein